MQVNILNTEEIFEKFLKKSFKNFIKERLLINIINFTKFKAKNMLIICKNNGGLFCISENTYDEENIKYIIRDYRSTLKVDINSEKENLLYNLLVKQLKKYINSGRKIYLEKIWNYLVRRKIKVEEDIDLIKINNLEV